MPMYRRYVPRPPQASTSCIDDSHKLGDGARVLRGVNLVAMKRSAFKRLLECSPAVHSGFTAFRTAMDNVSLSPALRSHIALFVAEAYGCEYTLSEAVKEARRLGIPSHEIDEARRGLSERDVTRAVLRFAEALIYAQGHVSIADLDGLRQAGFNSTNAVEIVGEVTLWVGACLFAQAAALAPEGDRINPFYERE
jgi:AhpD family alkylhydroperoxidase